MTDPIHSASGWTIDTLKEFFEGKLAAIQDQIKSRDTALELQATENKRRLSELNHEHARVAAAQETYVSKDTWDGYVNARQAWTAGADRVMQSSLPRSEFQTYKDSTEKALALKAGQSAGLGMTASAIASVISTCASIGAIIGVILVLTRSEPVTTVAPQVVYVPAPAGALAPAAAPKSSP